jgi:hypothetical protein
VPWADNTFGNAACGYECLNGVGGHSLPHYCREGCRQPQTLGASLLKVGARDGEVYTRGIRSMVDGCYLHCMGVCVASRQPAEYGIQTCMWGFNEWFCMLEDLGVGVGVPA